MSTQNPEQVFEKAQQLVAAGWKQVSHRHRMIKRGDRSVELDIMTFTAFRECVNAHREGREPNLGVLQHMESALADIKERCKQTQIQRWAVVSDGNPFLPPEMKTARLKGEVYNHPRKPDGKVVTTSRIVASKGRYVTTSSGTVYLLGRVDGGYRKFLKEQGLSYDAKNPVKVVG